MGILDFFRSAGIQKKWVFSAQGSIWRILFSEDGYIVGEDRDAAAKTLNFFCLDELTGKAVWLGRKFGDDWWSGIEAVAGNIVFIHSFTTPQMPEHRGIIAVDIRSGERQWERSDVRFVSAAGGSVYAVRDSVGHAVYFRLDRRTGEVLGESNTEPEEGEIQAPALDERRYRLPEILTPEEREIFAAVTRHIRQEDLVGNIEFIHADEIVLFNYHKHNAHSTPVRPVLDNVFSIVSLANEHVLYTEILDTDASYPVPDTFFIHDEILFYIKNRSVLTAVTL